MTSPSHLYNNIKRPYDFSLGSFVGGALVGAGLLGLGLAIAGASFYEHRNLEYRIRH